RSRQHRPGGPRSAAGCGPDPVVVHQPSQRLAIEKDDPPTDPLNLLSGIISESRRRDEYALGGALAFEAARERLEVRPTHRMIRGPPLRLDVDRVEPELVLVDHAVDPVVTGTTDVAGCILLLGAAVVHRDE